MNATRDGKFRALIRAAKRQGWAVRIVGSGHWQLVPPDKSKPIVHTAFSPGDFRGVRNFEAQLRRAGLVLP